MRKLFTSPQRAVAAAGLLLLGAQSAQAQTAYGLLSTNPAAPSLVTFDVTTPSTFTATVPITGLGAGQTLAGLDSRPNTGQLFALGYNAAATQAQLYTLNAATGALTPVGAVLALQLGSNPGRVGFDFNPTVDRIRVTGSNGGNYRLNPNNGALAATDGLLDYAPTDPNAGGRAAGVGGVAYTNSFIGATATTLYDVDIANNRLTIQNPPNNGVLNTVGPLNISNLNTADLDIFFNTTSGTNQAYLATTPAVAAGFPSNSFYTVNLTTGAATSVGTLGPQGSVVTNIALQIMRTVPATVTGQLAYALAGSNLVTFDTALPGTIRTSVGITGVDAAQTLAGLDIRPATNSLYAFGYNATAQTYQLYSLNAQTGVATAVNATPIALALGTGKVGFDFNPTVDRIRVTSGNRANFRLNPIDGTVAATDTQLAFATTDANSAATPNIGAVAYTNSVAGTTAATTVLYNYDLGLNILTTQNPPNAGTLNTVGSTGLTANASMPNVDLDIYSSAAGTNTAYLVANTGTSANTSLYTVNLTTGATTLVGAIGNGLAARDIAVAGNTGVATATRDRADLAGGVSLYPNPAAGSTRLTFALARASRVELSVFDAMGRRVATMPAAQLAAGAQGLTWDASTVRPGLYFVKLAVDGQPAATRQLVVR